MKDKIGVNTKIVDDLNLNAEAISVVVSLNGVLSDFNTTMPLTILSIGYYMFNRKPTIRERESIKVGIENLIKYGYVKIVEEYSKQDTLYDLRNIFTDLQSFYILVFPKEISKILNIDKKVNKYKLLRFYLVILSTINSKKKFGFTSQELLCQKANISIDTLRKYNNILIESELLYIQKHTGEYKRWVDQNGVTHVEGISNTYCRYEDRDTCIKDSKNASIHRGQLNIDLLNYRRKLKQKYNAMKKGKAYTEDEIIEIYNFMKTQNEIKQKEGSEDLYDLSMFDKYIKLN